mmetsp:Transcript_29604/g.26195  ORF Transcript_29604/g.26195 Transcript_29604/m.26195 type:complete len:106 (+) Transcript_29604:462-779(+)
MYYPNKVKQKHIKIFNKNPLFGGPKYNNQKLVEHELERSLTLSKKVKNSVIEDPVVNNKFNTRQRTKRLFLNRYANRSDFTLDWNQNVSTKGYQHPLGKNHTALD